MSAGFEDARDIARRVCIEATLELASPCHLGGADADATSEQPLVRDANGRPYLPGTTLAGLLRAAVETGAGGDDARAAWLLFGDCWGEEVHQAKEAHQAKEVHGVKEAGEANDVRARQSRLIVDDAVIAGDGEIPTELRDGVKIDPERGTAEDKHKYDIELLPVGTRFSLAFEVALPKRIEPRPVLAALTRLLAALESNEITFGARSRRGFGRASIVVGADAKRWRVTEYDTAVPAGVLAWIARGLTVEEVGALGAGWPPQERGKTYADAKEIAAAWGCAAPRLPARRPVFEVALPLEVDGSLIVRSGGHQVDEPDSVHLTRMELDAKGSHVSVLPGTSVAGVLRHRCLRIARTLAGPGPAREDDEATRLVKGMFGELGRASRVRVSEARITGATTLRHTRVRIDPWTGGALDSFLFTEDPLYGGDVTIAVSLQEPTDSTPGAREVPRPHFPGAERALLLLALRDLATGDLPVGGESGAGRGRLRTAAGRVLAETRSPAAKLRSAGDGVIEVEPAGVFDADFEELHRVLGGG